MNRTCLSVVWLSIGLLPFGANAQTVRYSFTGTVTGVTGIPFSGIDPQAGDLITGHLAYDLGSTDDVPLTAVSRYLQSPPSILAIKLRGVTFSSDGDFYSYVQNNYSGPSDVFQVADGYHVGGDDGDTILVSGSPDIGTVEIVLAESTGTVWDSDTLPAKLDPADFSSMVGFLGVLVENGVIDVFTGASFVIHTLTAIPEPASIWLLSIGAMTLWPRRRRTRTDSRQK